MKKILLVATLFSMYIGKSFAQDIQAVQADELIARVDAGADTTYVINFWATWCAPCVKEMPYFEALNAAKQGQAFKVIFVSLDFKKDYQTRLPAFIAKRNIQSEVVFMNEKDANEWVPKFSEQWSGVIPATWVVNRSAGISAFSAQAFEEGELEKWLLELGVEE